MPARHREMCQIDVWLLWNWHTLSVCISTKQTIRMLENCV